MSGWYLYKSDKKNSLRLTVFIILVIIISLFIRFIFPSIDHNLSDSKKGRDSLIIKK